MMPLQWFPGLREPYGRSDRPEPRRTRRTRQESGVLQITVMRILFFAQLRDITGKAQVELARDELSTNELWTELIAVYPALAPFRSVVRLARNQEYVGRDARFTGADEVALIPPVSGG